MISLRRKVLHLQKRLFHLKSSSSCLKSSSSKQDNLKHETLAYKRSGEWKHNLRALHTLKVCYMLRQPDFFQGFSMARKRCLCFKTQPIKINATIKITASFFSNSYRSLRKDALVLNKHQGHIVFMWNPTDDFWFTLEALITLVDIVLNNITGSQAIWKTNYLFRILLKWNFRYWELQPSFSIKLAFKSFLVYHKEKKGSV